MIRGVTTEAWEFTAVCIPVVVIGAPLGSVIGTHFHRLVLAAWIYLTDTVALVSAFILVPQTPLLSGISVAIIVFGFIFFILLTKAGERLMMSIESRGASTEQDNANSETSDNVENTDESHLNKGCVDVVEECEKPEKLTTSM